MDELKEIREKALRFARQDVIHNNRNHKDKGGNFWNLVESYEKWIREGKSPKKENDGEPEDSGYTETNDAKFRSKFMNEVLFPPKIEHIYDHTGRFTKDPAKTIYFDTNETPLVILDDKNKKIHINKEYYGELCKLDENWNANRKRFQELFEKIYKRDFTDYDLRIDDYDKFLEIVEYD